MLILGEQSKFSEALWQVQKQHLLKCEILGLGSYNNLAQHGKWNVFFLQNHSTLGILVYLEWINTESQLTWKG